MENPIKQAELKPVDDLSGSSGVLGQATIHKSQKDLEEEKEEVLRNSGRSNLNDVSEYHTFPWNKATPTSFHSDFGDFGRVGLKKIPETFEQDSETSIRSLSRKKNTNQFGDDNKENIDLNQLQTFSSSQKEPFSHNIVSFGYSSVPCLEYSSVPRKVEEKQSSDDPFKNQAQIGRSSLYKVNGNETKSSPNQSVIVRMKEEPKDQKPMIEHSIEINEKREQINRSQNPENSETESDQRLQISIYKDHILPLLAPEELDDETGLNSPVVPKNKKAGDQHKQKEKQKKKKNCGRKLRRFWRKVKVPIAPDCKFRLTWDILLMIVVVSDMFITPLQIAFDALNFLTPLQRVFDAMFVIDIFMSFHTGFYKNGSLVTNHKKIAKRYLRTWFVVDLIVAFPYYAFEGLAQDDRKRRVFGVIRVMRLLKIIRALKFFKVNHIFQKIKAYYGASSLVTNIIQMFKLLIVVLLVAHWLACGWAVVAEFEQEGGATDTWIYAKDLQDSSDATIYLYSLYWAVVTMLTVGYGDIIPTTEAEVFYVVFSIFFACATFGYILSSINSIIQALSSDSNNQSANVYAVNRFMMKNHIDKKMQEKIRGYLEYVVDEENNKKQYREQFLALMPENLKRDILMSLNGSFLTQNIILGLNFSEKFLKEVSADLKELTFCPGEIILSELEETIYDPSSFCIVTKGKIELYLKLANQTLKVLKHGDYFGAILFFSGKNEKISVKSQNYAHALCLQKKNFLTTLEKYKEDKESYCQIYDLINVYNDYSKLRRSCFVCSQESHTIFQCPHLQYIPDSKALIEAYTQKSNDFKRKFIRKPRRRYRALLRKPETVRAACFLQEQSPSVEKSSSHLSKEIEKELEKVQEVNEPASVYEEECSEDQAPGFQSNVSRILTHSQMQDHENDLSPLALLKRSVHEEEDSPEFVFDRVHSFIKYFPHNNVENVIAQINKSNEGEAGRQGNGNGKQPSSSLFRKKRSETSSIYSASTNPLQKSINSVNDIRNPKRIHSFKF